MVTVETAFSKQDLLQNLMPDQPLILFGVSWSDYEKIVAEFGESSPFHVTFNKGILTIMPVSEIHELLTALVHDFIRFAALSLRLNVIATGKATMQSKRRAISAEPDGSYFVTKAGIHKVKNYVPTELELAPDIVVEIDIHHASEDKFEIYAEFGVPEFWQYNGEELKIFRLKENGTYGEIEKSVELPILSAAILTEFLRRGKTEEQLQVLLGFQNWLREQTTQN